MVKGCPNFCVAKQPLGLTEPLRQLSATLAVHLKSADKYEGPERS